VKSLNQSANKWEIDFT